MMTKSIKTLAAAIIFSVSGGVAFAQQNSAADQTQGQNQQGTNEQSADGSNNNQNQNLVSTQNQNQNQNVQGQTSNNTNTNTANGGAGGGGGSAVAYGGRGGAGGAGGAGGQGGAGGMGGMGGTGTGGAASSNATSSSTSGSSNSNSGGNTLSTTGSNVTSISTTYQAQDRNPVSSAHAAHLTASNGTCMGSSSAGAQGVSFGISIGSTWRDSGCDTRYDAQALQAMGEFDVARARLCLKPEIAEAYRRAGKPCPEDKGPTAAAPIAAFDGQQQAAVSPDFSQQPAYRSAMYSN